MPDEVHIVITRADLPKADPSSGLNEGDFDLSKAKVLIDGAAVQPDERSQDFLKVKAPNAGDGLGRMAVTTAADKLIGSFDYDRKIRKIIRHKIVITRADLFKANSTFGLSEKDFDLSTAKVWIDGASAEPDEPKQDPLKVKALLGDGQGTIVVTTAAGKFIGVLDYDRKFREIIRQKNGSGSDPTLRGLVDGAVDRLVLAIEGLRPKGGELEKIIETAAEKIVKAINGSRANQGEKNMGKTN